MKPVCLELQSCNGVGDLICATPTISKLRQAYERKVTVISPMPELFKMNPDVAESYKASSVDHGYFAENYIMHNSFYNVGKKNDRGIEYKHNRIDIRQFHAIHLGFMLRPDEMDCYYRPVEPERDDLKLEGAYVVIHPVATWGTRTWPAVNWMLLTERLNAMGIKVVSIGKDSSERGFFNVDKPVFNFEIPLGMNLMNKTSLSDCWHLISNSMCFVSMDSGLMHLAGTTDANIIHLGSSLAPEFRAPYRKGAQSYKYSYIPGGCRIECGSDMKYGVREWGNVQGVPPLIRCLEGRETFECHPDVDSVFNKIISHAD